MLSRISMAWPSYPGAEPSSSTRFSPFQCAAPSPEATSMPPFRMMLPMAEGSTRLAEKRRTDLAAGCEKAISSLPSTAAAPEAKAASARGPRSSSTRRDSPGASEKDALAAGAASASVAESMPSAFFP